MRQNIHLTNKRFQIWCLSALSCALNIILLHYSSINACCHQYEGGGVFTYKPFCVVLVLKCNRLAGVVCRRMVIPYEGQSFSTLRRQCLQNSRLFEDPLFPAADQSLFYQTNRVGRVTWKRPKVSTKHQQCSVLQNSQHRIIVLVTKPTRRRCKVTLTPRCSEETGIGSEATISWRM